MPRHCEGFRNAKTYFNTKFSDYHLFDASCVRSLLKLHNVVKPSVSFSDVVKTGIKHTVPKNVYSKQPKCVKNVNIVKNCVHINTKPQGERPDYQRVKSRLKSALNKSKGSDTVVIPLKNKFTPLQNSPVLENDRPIVQTVKVSNPNSQQKSRQCKRIENVKAIAYGNSLDIFNSFTLT